MTVGQSEFDELRARLDKIDRFLSVLFNVFGSYLTEPPVLEDVDPEIPVESGTPE